MSNLGSRVRWPVLKMRIVPEGAGAKYYVLEFKNHIDGGWAALERSIDRETLELTMAQVSMGVHSLYYLRREE